MAGTIAERQQELEEEFALFDEWRDKIDYIMDLGRTLPPYPDDVRDDAHRVHGCQSQVWMDAAVEPESGRLRLRADSDAIIVKGLIGLLLRLYDDATPVEIVQNPPEVLERIGLKRHLTPTRANGLYSMIGRIRELAAQHAV